MALSRRELRRARTAAGGRPTGRPTVFAIAYRISMPDPASHEFHVEMDVPALPERATADIVFPAWAPGSYLVRDFVRHVYGLTVTDAR